MTYGCNIGYAFRYVVLKLTFVRLDGPITLAPCKASCSTRHTSAKFHLQTDSTLALGTFVFSFPRRPRFVMFRHFMKKTLTLRCCAGWWALAFCESDVRCFCPGWLRGAWSCMQEPRHVEVLSCNYLEKHCMSHCMSFFFIPIPFHVQPRKSDLST